MGDNSTVSDAARRNQREALLLRTVSSKSTNFCVEDQVLHGDFSISVILPRSADPKLVKTLSVLAKDYKAKVHRNRERRHFVIDFGSVNYSTVDGPDHEVRSAILEFFERHDLPTITSA